jgi:hypothetical protein
MHENKSLLNPPGTPLGRIDIKDKGPMEMVRVDRLRQ